jgi:hypothetical protein
MLVGALAGFVAGAVIGMGDAGFTSPIVLPFVGALCGVLVAAVPFLFVGAIRTRREDREREAGHDEFRVRAHDGWIEGVDLSEASREG